ncbi:uncharacterized protein LOC115623741 [Scaptodrosophila lebanonensis]|uniref:Uncharacterized protein LOC115623741 n=1 Tax=Drosophila lebanonensis TaxID=7225 RepID=A0A6J2TDN8_DROLE|nr:uncharacterized protein LOC115623741 [Scaptodrosophila lebanonensis]
MLKMTNAVCESYNKTWVVFDLCRLKVFGRNQINLNIVFNILHPIDNILVRLQVVKKANGYKPWLMDYTFNGCEYMRRRSQPFAKLISEMIKDFTTVNHTCPYLV